MSLKEKILSFFKKKKFQKKEETHSSFTTFVRDYFTFNKKERNGTIALIILIFIFTGATLSFRLFKSQTKPDTAEFKQQVDEFLASAKTDSDENDLAESISTLDPNTATENEFLSLGLSKKQVAVIINYRNKGGVFRKKEDFAKIYSISKEEYARIEPLLVIAEQEEKIIEINTADSVELVSVKGIGPYIAMKIIEYRKKLGGFYSKEQLKEVHRIDSARYVEIGPFLSVNSLKIRKINLNTAPLDELENHPYIRTTLANSIASLKKQQGSFKNIEEIKKSHLVTEDVFRKIAPYLTVDQ